MWPGFVSANEHQSTPPSSSCQNGTAKNTRNAKATQSRPGLSLTHRRRAIVSDQTILLALFAFFEVAPTNLDRFVNSAASEPSDKLTACVNPLFSAGGAGTAHKSGIRLQRARLLSSFHPRHELFLELDHLEYSVFRFAKMSRETWPQRFRSSVWQFLIWKILISRLCATLWGAPGAVLYLGQAEGPAASPALNVLDPLLFKYREEQRECLDEAGVQGYNARFLGPCGDLTEADLKGADLRGKDLSGTRLKAADLSGANLSSAILRGADFSQANLADANLTAADLSGATFLEARLLKANLEKSDLSKANFSRAALHHIDFRSVKLDATDFSNAKFFKVNLSGMDLRKACLKGADVAWSKMNKVNLEQMDLSGGWFDQTELTGAQLDQANLEGAKLLKADLSDALLAGVKLSKAELSQGNLQRARLAGADLSETNLVGADLSGADLQRANLRGANLMNARIRAGLLQGADLSETTIYGTDFQKADLRGANLSGGHLGEKGKTVTVKELDVSFHSTNFVGAIFDDKTRLPFGTAEAASRKMVSASNSKKVIKAIPLQLGAK